MLNESSVQAVNTSWFNRHFRQPLLDSYCFSRIPALVEHVLTGEGDSELPSDVLGDLPRRYRKVILLYVDAFGWRFLEKYTERYPFLRRCYEQGVVSKLTSQFPSTTACHVTTIHTGQPVGQTGIYEWFYYEPLLDRIIAPLIFSYPEAGLVQLPARFNIQHLFPFSTIFQRLAQHGVNSVVFQDADYTPSTYSNLVYNGARVRPFKTLAQALLHLADAVNAETERGYFFLYYDPIDAMGHYYGPTSPEFEAELDTFMTAAERLLHNNLVGKTGDTLLLITADHGQVEVSPPGTVYINMVFPAIRDAIKRNDEGRLLAPAGSARDLFFHIHPDRLDEVYETLTNLPELQGKAEVHKVADLLQAGLFGTPSQRLLERVGNLVILPYPGESVYWYQKGLHEQTFYGHHGGLTPAEMDIPLLALSY
jgi:hypothetical protein